MSLRMRGIDPATTTEIFLHFAGLLGLRTLVSHVVGGLTAGARFLDVARSLLSMDQASSLGIIAFVIVVFADTSRLVSIGFGDTLSALKPPAVADAPMRRAVWDGIGMVAVVLWGFVIAFNNQFRPDLALESHGVTMSAFIVAVSLVLSAAILASVLMLIARLNAVASDERELADIDGHLEQADRHLAVIARHRARPSAVD